PARREGVLLGRPLVLIGGPGARDWSPERPGDGPLPSPPSLAVVSAALSAALGGGGAGGHGAGSLEASEPSRGYTPRRFAAAKLSGSAERDYSGLLDQSAAESAELGLVDEFDIMLSTISDAAAAGDSASIERMAKRYHDGFADAGAVACAKLALAISLDVRKGVDKRIATALSMRINGGNYGAHTDRRG
ncbi:MAG: hypothetical protein KKA67_09720, partial [Spirochaetes bacterium]|nr:hypothetical protein [Spirochaetota bacterium]